MGAHVDVGRGVCTCVCLRVVRPFFPGMVFIILSFVMLLVYLLHVCFLFTMTILLHVYCFRSKILPLPLFLIVCLHLVGVHFM